VREQVSFSHTFHIRVCIGKNQSVCQLAGYIHAMHESGRVATRSDNQLYLCSTEGHGKSAEHDMEDGQEEHKDMQLVQRVG
jgi:hypothetical protein